MNHIINVTTSPCFVYSARCKDHGGWAKIFIHTGVSDTVPEPERHHHWAYVSVISDFGNFGYTWASMGGPVWEFLPKLDFDYAMRKFLGRRLDVFDADASIKALRSWVCENRRDDTLDAETARALYDAADSLDDDTDKEFFAAICHADGSAFHDYDLYQLAKYKPDSNAVAFWERIWVPFMQTVKPGDIVGKLVK